jgi:hypothetical protein
VRFESLLDHFAIPSLLIPSSLGWSRSCPLSSFLMGDCHGVIASGLVGRLVEVGLGWLGVLFRVVALVDAYGRLRMLAGLV